MFVRALKLPVLFTCGALLSACGGEPDPVGVGPGEFDGSVVPGVDAGGNQDGGGPLPGYDSGVVYIDAGGGDGGCGSLRAETQQAKAAVDVVWVIDDSFSMLPKVLAVGDNMARFMNGVRTSGANIEVMMVTGPIIGSYLQGAITDMNYHWIAAPVQSYDSYSWALNMYNDWSKFRRPGAPLHIIVVSDDSSNMRAGDFLTQMRAKNGGAGFTVHAVATDGLVGACSGPGAGTEYFSAAMMTGGEQLKLCGDWGAAFQKLQSNVIASVPLPCDYAIPPPPNGESLDPNAVQVVYTPAGGADDEFARATTVAACADAKAWYFDNNEAPSKVVMCPTACETVKAGGAISIGFGCAPSVILE